MFELTTEYKINDKTKLSVINIPELNENIINLIDEHIVEICEAGSNNSIANVKRRIISLFEKKTNDWKMGAIAEFFTHLYIRTQSYKQEFLYFNLEEESIKKGFDGLFSKNETYWLMESKSGSINTQNITHKSKVKEAIKDLSNKVAGKIKNKKHPNPWQNAYNHAVHGDVNPIQNLKLKDELNKLSNDFRDKKYSKIEDFNIIPSGTIFLDGTWQDLNANNEILKDIQSIQSDLIGKNIFIVCMTQNTIDMFIDYLQGN